MTLAAVLDDGSDDLVVTDIEVDAPRGREVVVRTLATGLCHSDLHFIDGVLTRPRPVLLGHEAVGIVEAIGPGVDSVSVGDRVVTCLVVGCGRCARCEQGEPYVCADPNAVRRARGEPARMTMADGRAIAPMANIGALADRMLVDERALVKIPESMPPTLAAIVGCAVVTGVGSVFNVAKVRPSETVAVIGCGGVGLNVVQGARIAGASRVIAVDVSASKLDLARKLGATDAVDASQDDAVEVVRALVGEGVDHAFEVIGRAETARQAFEMAAPGRRRVHRRRVSRRRRAADPDALVAAGQVAGRRVHGRHSAPRRHPALHRTVGARPARPRVDGLRRHRARRRERRLRRAQAWRGRPRRRQLRLTPPTVLA